MKTEQYTAKEIIEKSKQLHEEIEIFPEPGYEVIDNFVSTEALKKMQNMQKI